MRTYQKATLTLHNTDCLTLLSQLPDNSIDLIATDPPYYKVKGEAWDNQWRNKADFFAWLDTILLEYHRVLKPAGSLYLFAGPHLATQVDVAVSRRFNLLNHIIWRKPSGRHNGCNKESLRRYFPQTEHIMFAESRKKTPFAFEPIRGYLDNARTAANISRKQIDQACVCQMSGHWFDRSQWTFPSLDNYQAMDKLFGNTLKPYDQLKMEYKAIKQQRRHFAVTKHVPYTNVWDFKPVQWYPGKHPCEKPLDLMRHIIEASSKPGDMVLDTFVGSGSTAMACRDLNRRFIGCEMGTDEFDGAVDRLG
ncbi:MAG: DNA-methyltransferase [Methylobacter sp.]